MNTSTLQLPHLAGRRLKLLVLSSPLLIVACLLFGAVNLPLNEIAAVTKLMLNGQLSAAEQQYPRTAAILLHIRLPRVLAAIIVGAALGIAGAVTQGLFRNPLASPDILGISSGSSLGAVLVITANLAPLHPMVIPAAAIIGAFTIAAIIYLLALRSAFANQLIFVLLAGLALSTVLSGAISAVLLMAQQYEISQFVFWTMGALSGRMWAHILWPAPLIILVGITLIRRAHSLNILALGDHNAHGIGLNVSRTQRSLLLHSALLTALAIAIAGPIGFIGLMVPHLTRLLFSPDHRLLLPLSGLVGAMFLLFADLIGRVIIAPHEIKVGVLTSLIGGCYFLLLVFRMQQQGKLL